MTYSDGLFQIETTEAGFPVKAAKKAYFSFSTARR